MTGNQGIGESANQRNSFQSLLFAAFLAPVFLTSCAKPGKNSGLLALLALGEGGPTENAAVVAPTISYSGGPYTYTQNSAITTLTPTLTGSALTHCSSSPALPTGLTLNTSSCAISGTPTGTQASTKHTITATNSAGSGTTDIHITVNAAGTAPTVSYGGSPYTFTQNTAITTVSPTLGGDPVTSCTASPTLPAGLSINFTSCAISGTPTALSENTPYTITASNANGSATAVISIRVSVPIAFTRTADINNLISDSFALPGASGTVVPNTNWSTGSGRYYIEVIVPVGGKCVVEMGKNWTFGSYTNWDRTDSGAFWTFVTSTSGTRRIDINTATTGIYTSVVHREIQAGSSWAPGDVRFVNAY